MALRPLSETPEFQFPAGAFDVRGWEVRTMVDGEKVGEVEDILIDENANIRYLDVDLGLFKKHVLIPIGQARVDEAADTVWVAGMTKRQFERIPEYNHDVNVLTPEYENRLSASYSGAYGGPRYYEPREREAGVPRTTATLTGGERLASLGDLKDFRVAEGDPDPRGWELIAADGEVIGKVHELVIDTAAMKVRYLDCDLDEKALGLEEENRHILVPIGYARLDEDEERVIVDAISSTEVASLPEYSGLPVTGEYEERLHRTYTGGVQGEERYRHPVYGAERRYEARDPSTRRREADFERDAALRAGAARRAGRERARRAEARETRETEVNVHRRLLYEALHGGRTPEQETPRGEEEGGPGQPRRGERS